MEQLNHISSALSEICGIIDLKVVEIIFILKEKSPDFVFKITLSPSSPYLPVKV